MASSFGLLWALVVLGDNFECAFLQELIDARGHFVWLVRLRRY